MAAPGKSHNEDPRPTQFAGLGVDHQPGVARVHLDFLAWRSLHPHRYLRCLGLQVAHEAVHRGVAADVPALLQPIIDGGNLDILLAQLLYLFAVRLHRGDVLEWGRTLQRLVCQSVQFAQARQWPRWQPVLGGPGSITPHRLAVDPGSTRNGAVALTGLQLSQDLSVEARLQRKWPTG